MTYQFDALILGAGAAGLMCAIEAGKRGRRIAILERAERAGKKILISGGGRCNFTNVHCGTGNFISANPHFAKSALARFPPGDFISLVEKHGIPYHEKTLGQLFCDRSATDILDLLEAECHAAGVETFLNCRIDEVRHAGEFVICAQDKVFRAPVLVVATGGLSIPKMGASGFGYELARQFGLNVRTTRPGLVPLVLGQSDLQNYCDLAGVSTEVRAEVERSEFQEAMLITHRGLSGPAILQVSSYWTEGQPIRIDLAPGCDLTSAIMVANERNLTSARAAFSVHLPKRFAKRWLDLHAPANWSNVSLTRLEQAVHRWVLTPEETEGYEKAEVTVGGVDTDELSSKTLESSKVSGLFFIGEVVDVTGHLGGFNFQWAWASGAAAGRAI